MVTATSRWLETAAAARLAGQPDEAASAYLRVLEIDPANVSSLRGLYYLPFGEPQRQAFLPHLRHLIEAAAPHPLAFSLLAHWLREDDRAAALMLNRQAARHGLPLQRLAPLGSAAALAGGLPEVVILGAPKSGTTSLAAYLAGHPSVWLHPLKELHFFDNHWSLGEAWYRSQFPPLRSPGLLRLEATPDYLQHPQTPQRMHDLMPETRLIVLLREPLDRALSWIRHMRSLIGLQGDSEALLRDELERLEAMGAEELAGLGWFRPNALSGSLYDQQLRRWLAVWPASQLLLLRFEDLAMHPEAVLRRCLAFLGLRWDGLPSGRSYPVHNQGQLPQTPIDPALARRCREGVLAEALELWTAL
ncbi:MAG: sulfotransferase [Cyanobium sp. LacPavin_0920_WC12_MAG_63_22]|nr:sulfotransferase [Cyanobium sp. LacPavin_0920_WC12_MAG_63_22]